MVAKLVDRSKFDRASIYVVRLDSIQGTEGEVPGTTKSLRFSKNRALKKRAARKSFGTAHETLGVVPLVRTNSDKSRVESGTVRVGLVSY